MQASFRVLNFGFWWAFQAIEFDDLWEQAGRSLNLLRRATRKEMWLAPCVWQAPGVWDFLSLPSWLQPCELGCQVLLCPFPFSWNRFSQRSSSSFKSFSSLPLSFFLNKVSLCSFFGGEGMCPMSQDLIGWGRCQFLLSLWRAWMSPDLGKITNYTQYSSEAGTHWCVFLAGFWLDAALLPLGLAKAPALPRPCSS